MTAIQKEADEIISLMRQSKMDKIRSYLEKIMKGRDVMQMNSNSLFVDALKKMFKEASNNAPLP
jgi:hypothetical protein